MSNIPWWANSPSPMTLAFYSLISLYGSFKLGSKTKREWLQNFAESAFVAGLVILPFDSTWMILQWFKWSSLYPSEGIVVVGVLIRNLAIFSLCLLSAWKLSSRTLKLDLRHVILVVIPILSLLARTLIVQAPVWTDWTWGLRFDSNSPWLLSYLSGLPDKASLGFVYVALWRRNFLRG